MNYNDDNHIECPGCGRLLSLELTRCPTCGVNIYPEDYEQNDDHNPDHFRMFFFLLSLVLGGITGSGFIFLIFLLFKDSVALSSNQQIIISIISIVGAFLSGLIGGSIFNEKPILLGFLEGLLIIGTHRVLDGFLRDISGADIVQLNAFLTWCLILLISTIGTYSSFRLFKKQKNNEFPENEYQIYKMLLSRVQNDPKIVDRLIEFERSKSPKAGREELLRNALQRWMRDNRL